MHTLRIRRQHWKHHDTPANRHNQTGISQHILWLAEFACVFVTVQFQLVNASIVSFVYFWEHNSSSISCGCSQCCRTFTFSHIYQSFCGLSVSLLLLCKSLSYCPKQKCVLSAHIPQGSAVQENQSGIHRYGIERQAVYSFFQADIHSWRFMAVLENM